VTSVSRSFPLCAWLLATLGLLVSGCVGQPVATSRDVPARETVVLLHGLGRGKASMWLLASRIEQAGFDVVRIGYESLSDSPQGILASVGRQIDACCADLPGPLHLVGHSFGGLLIRGYLAGREPRWLGRVVLIGTPNAGTPLVDMHRDAWWMDYLGPTARRLGTQQDSFPNSLPQPNYPVGVIAGVWEAPMLDDLIPDDSDGLVPRASTRVEGMTDFVVVESNHWSLRYSREVALQTIAFLRTGRFSRND
jgi:pimeloyl-ACP methyl ester carboxylesterase